jgi:hypothetical protein
MNNFKKVNWLLNEYKNYYRSLAFDLKKIDESIKLRDDYFLKSLKIRKLAIALLAIPDPTHITDFIGAGLLIYDNIKIGKSFDIVKELFGINRKISRLNYISK